jgi:hypothetical protein
MTQDEIIKLARETLVLGPYESATGFNAENAIKFANLVARHEREACSSIASDYAQRLNSMTAVNIADAIRARKQA